MPVERRTWITRGMLRREREKLFVFGDNLARWGFGGQALEMRQEANAVGLPTKRSPGEYLTDADLDLIRFAAHDDIKRLRAHLEAGGVVVWPGPGIGTGRAALPLRAPAIAAYYDKVLSELEAIGAAEQPD